MELPKLVNLDHLQKVAILTKKSSFFRKNGYRTAVNSLKTVFKDI